jgi:hypothetical protein
MEYSRRMVVGVAALIATWVVFFVATFASSISLGWLSSLSHAELTLVQAACALITVLILVMLALKRRRAEGDDV